MRVWASDEAPLFDVPEVSRVPYLNLDDQYADHPKVDALSDGAFRLQTSGLCYAARKLTDGFVEESRVHRLMPVYKPKYLAELLDAGVWIEVVGGFQIHDYLDWNKSRAWWLEHREKEAKRIAAWRAKQQAALARLQQG
ncbi:hypothetical protein [Nocardioides sp.]|uniref:hypothetical protein n=1 Tax=Nocardioides sp. TaxID=35761 RepID=UPI0032197F15